MSTLKNALSVFGTLAFGLPGPWGVVASGAIQALGYLLPSDDGPDPLIRAVQQSVVTLETFITQHNLQVDTSYTVEIKKAMATIANVRNLYSNPVELQKAIDSIEPLKGFVSPLAPAFADLDSLYTKPDTDQPFYETAATALSTYVSLHVTVAQCLALQVALAQALAVYYVNSGREDEQELAYDAELQAAGAYDFLSAYLAENLCGDDCIADLRATLKTLRTARLAQVSTVQTVAKVFDHHVYYTDEGVNAKADPPVEIETTDYDPGGTGYLAFMPNTHDDMVKQVDAKRLLHIGDVMQTCDTYETQIMTIPLAGNAARASAPRIPAPPSQSPDVELKETGWKDAWRFAGKYVNYEFYFCFPDPPGRTVPSKPANALYTQVSATGTKVPRITIPADPSGFASTRVLIRSVSDDENGTKPTLYLILVPNMLDHYFDLWPLKDDTVCPNATIPPLLRYANFVAATPGRTWPDPYGVRYCYRYTNKNGASLQASPWSIPAAPGDYKVDAQGFAYIQNYYSFQMLVPYVAGCDFELTRQFVTEAKGRVIKHNLGAVDPDGMILVGDGEGK